MQLLKEEIGDRAYTGTLASDSSNVVELVEQLYRVRSVLIHYLSVHSQWNLSNEDTTGTKETSLLERCPLFRK